MFETGSKVGRQGQYVIQKKLGQGAFGAVYLADDTVSGIPVAIKTIPQEVSRNNEELDDLKSNFQLVYKLKHPHIASLNMLEHDQTLDEYLLRYYQVNGNA
jgi:eukaryotic-like serine/threonine-protein kinase